MYKMAAIMATAVALMGCSTPPVKSIPTQTTLDMTKSYIAKDAVMNKTHTHPSHYDFDTTVLRLKNAIEGKGMKIFAHIDHKAAAKDVGMDMQNAQVLVFGTPKAGTPLMQKDPTFALNLPLKVLITEDNGQVLVSYFDTHAIIESSKINFDEVENTLAGAEKLIYNTIQ